jgi:hypothetical protein
LTEVEVITVGRRAVVLAFLPKSELGTRMSIEQFKRSPPSVTENLSLMAR